MSFVAPIRSRPAGLFARPRTAGEPGRPKRAMATAAAQLGPRRPGCERSRAQQLHAATGRRPSMRIVARCPAAARPVIAGSGNNPLGLRRNYARSTAATPGGHQKSCSVRGYQARPTTSEASRTAATRAVITPTLRSAGCPASPVSGHCVGRHAVYLCACPLHRGRAHLSQTGLFLVSRAGALVQGDGPPWVQTHRGQRTAPQSRQAAAVPESRCAARFWCHAGL